MANSNNKTQIEMLLKETADTAVGYEDCKCASETNSSDCMQVLSMTDRNGSPVVSIGIAHCDDAASRDSFAEFADSPRPNSPSIPHVGTPTTSRPSTPLRTKDGRFAPVKSGLSRVSSDMSLSGQENGDNDSFYVSYPWPKDSGELFILQEQVSKYLGVLSFKRKYPEIYRRSVDAEEKQFLLDSNIVLNMVADMGLTALKLDEVHTLMGKDYPDKYELFAKTLKERRKKALSEKQKQKSVKISKEKMEQMRKRAIKSAADFNKRFNKERKLERKSCMDLQSYFIHKPRKPAELIKENTVDNSCNSLYPVAVIPNQYQDFCRSFTGEELLTLPLSSVMKESPVYKVAEETDEYGEIYSDSDESEISELSIDSNISDSMFEEVAQFAFASPAAKQIQLTERQKQLLHEQQSKQQQQMFEQERRRKHQQEQREKFKKCEQSKSPIESKFHKWLKERELDVADAVQDEMEQTQNGESMEVKVESVPKATSAQEHVKSETSEPSTSDAEVASSLEEDKPKELTCKICMRGESGDSSFVHCSFCRKVGHAKCLDITTEMLPIVLSYPWQCMDCKTCVHCMEPHHEDKMIFCDMCDRGFHTFCIGLRSIPTGRWVCTTCGMCNSCGACQPAANTTGDNKSTAWQHLYTESKDGVAAQFLTTLCLTCVKLWDRGHFCPICLQCFDDTSPQFTPMVCCDCCDRWIHPDCDNIDAMAFRTFSEHGQAYKCAICRGEKVEKYDKFHRKHRIQRYVEQSLKSTKVKKGAKINDVAP